MNSLVQRRLIHGEERGGIRWLEITHDVLAPLAVASRDERKEHERVIKAEKAAAKSRTAIKRFAAIAIAMGLLSLVSIGGLLLSLIHI